MSPQELAELAVCLECLAGVQDAVFVYLLGLWANQS